jgi:hypothetical protein
MDTFYQKKLIEDVNNYKQLNNNDRAYKNNPKYKNFKSRFILKGELKFEEE